jgi:hypothetical protein
VHACAHGTSHPPQHARTLQHELGDDAVCTAWGGGGGVGRRRHIAARGPGLTEGGALEVQLHAGARGPLLAGAQAAEVLGGARHHIREQRHLDAAQAAEGGGGVGRGMGWRCRRAASDGTALVQHLAGAAGTHPLAGARGRVEGVQGVQSRECAAAKLTGQPPCPRWPRRRTRGGAPRPPCWCACGACTRNGRDALVGTLGRISYSKAYSAQPGPPRKDAGR